MSAIKDFNNGNILFEDDNTPEDDSLKNASFSDRFQNYLRQENGFGAALRGVQATTGAVVNNETTGQTIANLKKKYDNELASKTAVIKQLEDEAVENAEKADKIIDLMKRIGQMTADKRLSKEELDEITQSMQDLGIVVASTNAATEDEIEAVQLKDDAEHELADILNKLNSGN